MTVVTQRAHLSWNKDRSSLEKRKFSHLWYTGGARCTCTHGRFEIWNTLWSLRPKERSKYCSKNPGTLQKFLEETRSIEFFRIRSFRWRMKKLVRNKCFFEENWFWKFVDYSCNCVRLDQSVCPRYKLSARVQTRKQPKLFIQRRDN